MNKIILICATIFVFVIGVSCAAAADMNVAGDDIPALYDDDSDVGSISIVKDNDFSKSQLRPDVQKVSLPEYYPDLEKELDRPIGTLWDHVSPLDYLKNMTDCGE